jgi:excisionase family DNA binding protein
MQNSQVDIVIKGQLVSDELVTTIAKDVVVPLLLEGLLKDTRLQAFVRNVHGGQRTQQFQNPTLMTITSVADRLGVKPVTVRSWIAQRRISSVRIGRCVRLESRVVDELIQENSVPARQPR